MFYRIFHILISLIFNILTSSVFPKFNIPVICISCSFLFGSRSSSRFDVRRMLMFHRQCWVCRHLISHIFLFVMLKLINVLRYFQLNYLNSIIKSTISILPNHFSDHWWLLLRFTFPQGLENSDILIESFFLHLCFLSI